MYVCMRKSITHALAHTHTPSILERSGNKETYKETYKDTYKDLLV